MSILVALTGSDASVVATDSRCIESDGTVRDSSAKTFRLPGGLAVGGHTGLLRFSGRTIPEWLECLPLGTVNTLDDLAREAKLLLEAEMSAISEVEVGFPHRRADIVLVGHDDLSESGCPVLIRAVVLRPDTDTRRVRGEIRPFISCCAAGDDEAISAVLKRVRGLHPQPGDLPRKRLATAARGLVALGIKKGGMSPNFPTVRSCGGKVSLVFL
jgi:hypothetical protein